jgi:hypothetical protein
MASQEITQADAKGFVTPGAIRQAFFEQLESLGVHELAYAQLWQVLKAQGAQLRGSTPKRERDFVYRALLGDPRIQRVRPGVFASYRPGI